MLSIIQSLILVTKCIPTNAIMPTLLAHQDTAVPHFAITKSLHGFLNSLGIQREFHGGGSNLLCSSKLDQRLEAVARRNEGTLDPNTLLVHRQQRNW
jgi:hypothetical protein